MKLDLSRDKQKIRKYILRRIKEYSLYVNMGPGKDDDPIRAVVLGFYASQGGYIYMVIDTRPGTNIDGNWTLHIDEPTMFHLPKWSDFYEEARDGKPLPLIKHDGTTVTIQSSRVDGDLDEDSEVELNACFGDMLKNLMEELRDDGSLAELPLAKDAFMIIEEFDNLYFWPSPKQCKTKGRILLK